VTGVPGGRHHRQPTGLAGLQPLYEQFALVVEDLQIKVDRRDRDREKIACTGMPEAPGTPAPRRPGDSPR
jgi:hypothetical protein